MGAIEPQEPAANRFARQFDELSSEEQGIAQGALIAARSTFADFADAEESHYYCADGLTPEETWHAITAEVARVTAIAAVEARDGGVLSAADFHAIHRAIFAPVFGSRTLEQRKYEEDVTYGIVLGSSSTLRGRPRAPTLAFWGSIPTGTATVGPRSRF